MSPKYPPKMDALLTSPEGRKLAEAHGRKEAKKALGSVLGKARKEWSPGSEAPSAAEVLELASAELEAATADPFSRVVNATGVVIHTNLGRAPLSREILLKAADVMPYYIDLEWDRMSGERGSRDGRVEALMRRLLGTGMEVLMVNNCAAALLLVLNTLSRGREAVISRGELVEIGGRFRIPEVMASSGAVLREVGTTNRTSVEDYREAVGPSTGVLLKVHHSNFRIVGFTREASLEELVALGAGKGLPVVHDLGTGLVSDELPLGGERRVADALAAGPDVITFSGDKLLGGCQAGFILARKEHADRMRGNNLLRALRPDKLALFYAAETLLRYLRGGQASIPALAMLGEEEEALRKRAQRLKARVEKECGARFDMKVVSGTGRVGGGSAPLFDLPSPALRIVPKGSTASELERHLRLGGDPPVLAVVRDGAVHIHLRTVFREDAGVIADRLASFREGDR